MKLGDFDVKVLVVENMPEDEARFMQQIGGVEIKDGKIVCTYKELARFVNIGQPVEE